MNGFGVLCLTWEQDASGDALQDSAQGFSRTERACSAADHFLNQQLQSLDTKRHQKLAEKKSRIMIFSKLEF